MLIPDPEAIDTDVALLNEGHAEADEPGPLAGHVDPVGREDDLSVQGELVFRFRESGDERGEPGAHAPEDQLVSDLLEEFRCVAAALLDELDDLQLSGTLGGSLLVLGRAGVHAHVGVSDLLDDQSPGLKNILLDLLPNLALTGSLILIDGLAINLCYTEMLDHAEYRAWLHFNQPPYAEREKNPSEKRLSSADVGN